MSRVYADVNAIRGKSWYEYNKFRIEWSSPDRYEIVRRLGGGKYSEVFEGVDTVNSERIVIKVLKPVAGHKIKREIKVCATLAGAPNCIALLDVVRDPRDMYHSLVTEFVDNTDWSSLHSRLTDPDIRHYMFQLLSALDFVHSHGIMHRDIKPANVMIDHQRRELRVIDWGSRNSTTLASITIPVSGSRQYKSPELLVGYKRYDYSLDLWSTGCMFAAMQHFFRGSDNEDQLLKIMRVLGTEKFDAYLRAYSITLRERSRGFTGKPHPAIPRALGPASSPRKTSTSPPPTPSPSSTASCASTPASGPTAAEAMAGTYFGTVRVEGGRKEGEALSDSGFASM
ncbi:kinase-like domain-containing protein [Mycena alexandri]|uniref:Casein kinase II subunit alpha n=1 Tax=Mycena alexandri TaxID=1745969 RepID=A0AAD6S8M6_9AGAR|nr:kinase-like domain-containing protein [Mycena alexandri]